MLYPTLFGDRLFDDLMDFTFPSIREVGNTVDRKLYGKHAPHMMRTDVHEKEDGYEVYIDLPGFKKDEINLNLENGYLTVSAAKGVDKNEEDNKGKVIRRERYAGAMQRSFYIGTEIPEEDIKAKFEDGVLKLFVPKAQEKIPAKKTIEIED